MENERKRKRSISPPRNHQKNRSNSPRESKKTFLLRIDNLIEKVGNNSKLVQEQIEKLSHVLNEEKYDHLHHIVNTIILW
jgi:hypothetical protein